MAEFQGVTALTWGPWRAEFIGDAEAPIVRVRLHGTGGKRGAIVAEIPVDDPTEAGLRQALATLSEKDPDVADRLATSNPVWAGRMGVEKRQGPPPRNPTDPPPIVLPEAMVAGMMAEANRDAPRRPMRATKKTARKTKKR